MTVTKPSAWLKRRLAVAIAAGGSPLPSLPESL